MQRSASSLPEPRRSASSASNTSDVSLAVAWLAYFASDASLQAALRGGPLDPIRAHSGGCSRGFSAALVNQMLRSYVVTRRCQQALQRQTGSQGALRNHRILGWRDGRPRHAFIAINARANGMAPTISVFFGFLLEVSCSQMVRRPHNGASIWAVRSHWSSIRAHHRVRQQSKRHSLLSAPKRYDIAPHQPIYMIHSLHAPLRRPQSCACVLRLARYARAPLLRPCRVLPFHRILLCARLRVGVECTGVRRGCSPR